MDALNFLLQKARLNGDGSLTVSRDLLKKVKGMTAAPKKTAKPRSGRSRKKTEDE